MTTVIFRTATKFVVPIIMLVSIALFLQGHNAPGGGFIGGVLTASAFALIYIAYGLDFLEDGVLGRDAQTMIEHISHGVVSDYRHLFAIGLGIAAGSGLLAILLGVPFLTQGYVILEHVPIYGEVELASAVVFDLGVYAVVIGALLTILSVVGAE
ncbi:MnhB domain-containing protein [Halanaeroarchaeum sulfurireducens]|uniref:Na+/H+ antiporter MnhB subunit-related protein n=1 Tax=Halanaeroarchaeum sulfurireducens TaxID=1604004 RepID=A0A0F7PCE3_9EURY|nr:MnhB domain-containing protein [Halanaeroarchaeum sulfurireducens]AKH97309.1 Na+/H+ antiporter MnhB subunit-related protein [Halanaeroarchaeum sulfurireducens]ALG81711.1 Na+/H+ antiporter MnhB subunit-related protein [Halanaeroarchaeum sulfurireducens]